MNRMKTWTVVFAMPLLLVMAQPVFAEGQGSRGWQQFQEGLKKSARDVGKVGNEAGHSLVKGARKGGDALNQLFSGNGGTKQGKSK